MAKKTQGSTLLNVGNFVKASTYKEQAYDLIKDAILYRRLEVGPIYSQDSLCKELGISRTPVREALLELQQEGYVSFLRGRGIIVVPVTAQEAEDIVEMRACLEIEGSRLAAVRRTDVHVDRMRGTLEEMQRRIGKNDPKGLYRLDREFHRIMFEASRNKLMYSTIENLREQFLRIETQGAFDTKEGALDVCQEHQKILRGIEQGDADAAESAMREHLCRTYDRTVKPSLSAIIGNFCANTQK